MIPIFILLYLTKTLFWHIQGFNDNYLEGSKKRLAIVLVGDDITHRKTVLTIPFPPGLRHVKLLIFVQYQKNATTVLYGNSFKGPGGYSIP